MKMMRRWISWLLVVGLLVALVPPVVGRAQPPANLVFVRVAPGAVLPEGIATEAMLDYGGFTWLAIERAGLRALDAAGVAYVALDGSYALALGGETFDPAVAVPDWPAGWAQRGAVGPDLQLVQFIGPARAGWLAALEVQGLEVVQYVYPFTYIVWGEATSLQALTAASYVRWTGPFAPAYRVLPQWRSLPDASIDVDVLFYRGADVAAAIRRFEALGAAPRGRATLNAVFEIAGFTLSGAQLQAAAAIPGVYSIQPVPQDGGLRGEMSNQVNAGNVGGDNIAFPGYLDWLAGIGVNGDGVIMANVDGGVQDSHPDLVNRMVSCSGDTCGGGSQSGHGTHTAGIMAADGASGVTDSYGFLRGLGMAPGANLVEQVYSPWYTQPDGMLKLIEESSENSAVLSGNSWGPGSTPQGYDNDTLQVDIGVRDADDDVAGNQPFNYVLSIMNGNGGYQSQGSPDEAKNIFTVGSTKMQYSSGAQNPAINDLSSNTAHGPALDGRLIPHIVAPGCYVDSTVPTNSYSASYCGTSMASPHVSGAVALFIEYYRAQFGVDPSPALVKAAFLPVAHDLAGNQDADGGTLGHPFDAKQGWGRLNMAAVLDPQLPVMYFDAPMVFDNTGEVWETSLSAVDPSQPVRMMLVWTDAPGHGLGGATPAWVNNLDLEVEAGGQTYRGNAFGPDGWSATAGTADEKNNTEGVFLGPLSPDTFTVRVVATEIAGDAIPQFGDTTDQDFALVCYNCFEGADFTVTVSPDSLEICAPGVVTTTVAVAPVLNFTDAVTLAAVNLPTGMAASFAPSVVAPAAEATLTLDVGAGAAAGSYQVVISATASVTHAHAATLDLLVNTGVPGAPALLTPANGDTGQPLQDAALAWGAPPFTRQYAVQLGRDPFFASPLVSATGISTTTFTVPALLDPLTCYYWRVAGENVCGGGGWSETRRFSGSAMELAVDDDMESGAGLWLWQTDQGDVTWARVTSQAHSPVHAWHVADDSKATDSYLWYGDPLTVGMESVLSFWHRYEFEPSGWDGAVLELSTDAGASWVDLGPYMTAGGYNGRITKNTSNPLQNRLGWVNDLTTWTQVIVDLGAFTGESVLVRWRVGCDAAVGDTGWFIDDVQLTTPVPPLPAPAVVSVSPAILFPYEELEITVAGTHFVGQPQLQLAGSWLLSPTLVTSSTMRAIVPAGLASGTYTLTLINGDCREVALAQALTIKDAVPDVPQLVSPGAGAVFSTTTPVLIWSSSAYAAGYMLDLDGAVTDVGAVTHFTTPELGVGNHTWTAAAYDVFGVQSEFAPARTFTIEIVQEGTLLFLPLIFRD